MGVVIHQKNNNQNNGKIVQNPNLFDWQTLILKCAFLSVSNHKCCSFFSNNRYLLWPLIWTFDNVAAESMLMFNFWNMLRILCNDYYGRILPRFVIILNVLQDQGLKCVVKQDLFNFTENKLTSIKYNIDYFTFLQLI